MSLSFNMRDSEMPKYTKSNEYFYCLFWILTPFVFFFFLSWIVFPFYYLFGLSLSRIFWWRTLLGLTYALQIIWGIKISLRPIVCTLAWVICSIFMYYLSLSFIQLWQIYFSSSFVIHLSRIILTAENDKPNTSI